MAVKTLNWWFLLSVIGKFDWSMLGMTFGTLPSELAFETLWSWLRMLLSLSVSMSVLLTVSFASNVTIGNMYQCWC